MLTILEKTAEYVGQVRSLHTPSVSQLLYEADDLAPLQHPYTLHVIRCVRVTLLCCIATKYGTTNVDLKSG